MGILISRGGPVVGTGALKPTICAEFLYGVEYEITVTWKGECVAVEDAYCGCIPNKVFCVPRGDYQRIIVNVVDANGAAIDISGFSGIEYAIALDVNSVPAVSKSLGSGIVIGGDNASFVVTLTEADTALIPGEFVYHECRLSNGTEGRTIFAGMFRSQDTILGTD